MGDIIELEEGIKVSGSWEMFNKFYGIVRTPNVSTSGAENKLTCRAMDRIIRLEDLDINIEIESSKVERKYQVLEPIRESNDPDNYLYEYAFVFKFPDINISEIPGPNITVEHKQSLRKDPPWQGFEIDYINGLLKIGTHLNINEYQIRVDYSYYPIETVNYAEDVIE